MSVDNSSAILSSSTLIEREWRTSYRHEDGDLVALFYIPALSCAVQYDRTTGYFNASALALAARGIEQLIQNKGNMRLIVGCTLAEDEIKAIEEGYDLREKIEEKLASTSLDPPDTKARNGLAALAWMIGHHCLDVKVAVPVNPYGKPIVSQGIYHEKVGIITDKDGHQISFSGSINETKAGWIDNRESFHVHCSWEGERESRHVEDEVKAFSKLWSDKASSIKIFTFPEAAKQKLLEFMPSSDKFITPQKKIVTSEEDHQSYKLLDEEIRRAVWTYIHFAPQMRNGIQVGPVTSTVKPWPHQLQTFVRMFNHWPIRLLLADEVGLGKTITAGLLIRQAWLAEKAQRILIMVPKAVLPQWQNELYEKFNLNVPIYDGQKLIWRKTHGWMGTHEKKIGRYEWHQEPFVLCSSHLMRRRDRSQDLLDAEQWDLIVLDEAHHARRKAPGSPMEGGPNSLLRLMLNLRYRCKSLLLLTATPMQVHQVEIWDLLNLLGLPPQWAASENNFLRYFQIASENPSHEEMKFLVELFQDTESEFGLIEESKIFKAIPQLSMIKRRKILKALREKSDIPIKHLDAESRKATLEILRRFSPIRFLMARHTRELLRLYHKQGLLETPIATRYPFDVPIKLTPAERSLYDKVEDYIATTYNRATPQKRTSVGFVMTIYRRRLASSFHALKCTLTNRLQKMTNLVEEEDVRQDEDVEEIMDTDEAVEYALDALQEEENYDIEDLLHLIKQLDTDSKAKELNNKLDQIFAHGYDSVIIFTQYTDTLDYLKEFLADQYTTKTIACYAGRGGERRNPNGTWNTCSKEDVKLALKKNEIQILICTDAAGEGLNLQYCGALINYDLPWNPMKVEQRIGRIDRIGQKHAMLQVFNFAYHDTVEADVYFTLTKRINLFQGIVGKLQPILSRLPKEFENITLLSEEQRQAHLHRLLSDVETMVEDSEKAGFDIDEVAQEAAELPVLPDPSLTLEEIDTSLNRSEIRPPAMQWKNLDFKTYAVQMPGMPQAIRVTTNADVFDDHFDSHEFLSPGGTFFTKIKNSFIPTEDSPILDEGYMWLIQPDNGGYCEFVVSTQDGIQRINSLFGLLERIKKMGNSSLLDVSQWQNVVIKRII